MDTEILVDSGSSVSLVRDDLASMVPTVNSQTNKDEFPVLLTASGSERLSIVGGSSFELMIGNLVTVEKLLLVKNLVSPLILGTDLLGKHKIVVDFSEHLVKGEKIGAVPMTSRSISRQGLSCPACEVHKTEWRTAERYCAVAIHEELEDECAVPLLKKEETYDPPMASSEFQEVLVEYKSVFSTNPGNTSLMQHSIPTSGCHPARVPPRRIRAHYRVEVEKQLDDMIEQGCANQKNHSTTCMLSTYN